MSDTGHTALVRVKPLEWRGPDFDGEYTAFSIDKRYTILKWSDNGGHWLGGVGGYFSTIESAQTAAQADHERRILSAIEPSPSLPILVEALERAVDDPYYSDLDAETRYEIEQALASIKGGSNV